MVSPLLNSGRAVIGLTLLGSCLALAVTQPSLRSEPVKLANGVTFWQQTEQTDAGPTVMHVLRIDPKAPGVRLELGTARETLITDEPALGRGTVGETAQRNAALAAVNADFFNMGGNGRPLGLAIRNGELISDGMLHRVVFGLGADGSALMESVGALGSVKSEDKQTEIAIDGINRPPARDEITLVTPTYGSRIRVSAGTETVALTDVELPIRLGKNQPATVSETLIALAGVIRFKNSILIGQGAGADWIRANATTGSHLQIRFEAGRLPGDPTLVRGDLPSRRGSARLIRAAAGWADVKHAVGGGPWLVRDGKVYVDSADQRFTDPSFTDKRHPRTAIGVTASGEILLVAVDGRQSFSAGMTLAELAKRMIALGAVRAINLDGGGSTSMVIDGAYVNSPSDGQPRNVSDSILVFADRKGDIQQVDGVDGFPKAAVDRQTTTSDPIRTTAGKSISVTPPGAGANQRWIWGSTEGKGWVDQTGVFRAIRAGTHTVVASNASAVFSQTVIVEPAAPSVIRVSQQPVPNNPPDRATYWVTVADAYGNPIAGQQVRAMVAGGEADPTTAMTDASGRVEIDVVWDTQNRTVTFSSGNLAPVKVTFKPQP
jgi:hypothetical protein